MADNERLIERSKAKSQVIFDPQGSRIISLVLDGHPISSTVIRSDGKEANWHPCGPNFDQDPKGILPRHGTLRDSKAEILPLRPGDDPATIRTRAKIQASPYPEVEVVRTLTLTNKAITVATIYANFSNLYAPVNHGEHPYFLAPNGWEGTTLNYRSLEDRIKNDRIFGWKELNFLHIPGQPWLFISQSGLPLANPWTGQNHDGEYDKGYFSLSAVEGNPKSDFFGSRRSLVRPHSTSGVKKLVIAVYT